MNHNIKLLAAGIAAVGFASVAHAADLVIETPEAPVIAEPAVDWDGLFIGTFAGYAGGNTNVPVDIDLKGWLLGVNAGANFTLADGIVAGVIGDLAWSNIADDDAIVPPGSFDINWTGSIRARAGVAIGSFMPYMTAGIAFANASLYASDDGSEIGNNTHVGWTAGAGVEFKATDNLSVDVAYRFSDYGAAAYGVTDWDFTTHQVTAGLNWHF